MKTSRILVKLESRVWYITFAVMFRIILEIAYTNFVATAFEYEGFIYKLDIFKYLESWLIFVILLYFSPFVLKKASDYLVVYMLFAFVVPLLVYYALSNADRVHLYLVLTSVVFVYLFRSGRLLRVPYFRFGIKLVYGLLVIGSATVTAWMIASGGLKFFNLDLTRVYDFRREVGDVINQGLMAYLNVWATKVFGPVLLALSLWRKNYIIAFLVFLLHVLWFAISSHKSVLFYPFLVTFLWMWFSRSRALSLIPAGMSFVVLGGYLSYIFIEDILFGSLFIRRVFFVPSYLTFVYYEFFSKNDFVYWSNSILSNFIRYPYDLNTAVLIGDYLDTESHANNSFLSTGYMHAGFFGVIIYGILVGLLFRLIDSLAARGIPVWVAVASIIVPAQSLIISADLPTALLTHGIGASLVVLFLLRSASHVNEGGMQVKCTSQRL